MLCFVRSAFVWRPSPLTPSLNRSLVMVGTIMSKTLSFWIAIWFPLFRRADCPKRLKTPSQSSNLRLSKHTVLWRSIFSQCSLIPRILTSHERHPDVSQLKNRLSAQLKGVRGNTWRNGLPWNMASSDCSLVSVTIHEQGRSCAIQFSWKGNGRYRMPAAGT